MRIVAMIQARYSSTRLPGKVLLPVGNTTMLGQVIRRAKRIGEKVEVVVVTSEDSSDNPVTREALEHGVQVLRGPLDDVLARYAHAIQKMELKPEDLIIRLTGDCPGLDPLVSTAVLNLALSGDPKVEYTGNAESWPDGLDTEVIPVRALLYAHDRAGGYGRPDEREHVTTWIRKHRWCQELPLTPPQRWRKWSVDTEYDLEYVRELYKIYGEEWGWRDAVTADPGQLCEYCVLGAPPVRRSFKSIGGPRDYTVFDLHEVEDASGAGIRECAGWRVAEEQSKARSLEALIQP